MIEVQGLTKTYGQYHAVNQVSFKLETGETLALVGTSGSGKTTTLKLINRLIEPSGGQIFLNGEDIFALPPEQMRRRMGYVIQNIGLFPHYTIEENIAVVPKLLGWAKEKIKERSAYLLERLKLPAGQFFSQYPHQLSGGQQQRVGIARALAADPPVILMDEPFGALDPITRNVIRQDFINMEELSSKTTIIVTHDIEEAFELADRICVLDEGKLQQMGTPQDLLFRPANQFVETFIKEKKLDLEIRIFNLNDIFEFIPLPPSPPPENLPILEGKQSIKESMAIFTGPSLESSQAIVQKKDLRKSINLSSMMEAFHQFLKHQKS
jgi:osmoprotectant transport system ATP-binding protein